MLNNVEYLKNMLDSVRGMVQQSIMNERAREGSRSKPPYEDEDVTMYGDGMKQSYDMSGVKKRRGVSKHADSNSTSLLTFVSVLLHQDDAIAATELIHQSGDGAPMVLEPSVMHAAFTMLN